MKSDEEHLSTLDRAKAILERCEVNQNRLPLSYGAILDCVGRHLEQVQREAAQLAWIWHLAGHPEDPDMPPPEKCNQCGEIRRAKREATIECFDQFLDLATAHYGIEAGELTPAELLRRVAESGKRESLGHEILGETIALDGKKLFTVTSIPDPEGRTMASGMAHLEPRKG